MRPCGTALAALLAGAAPVGAEEAGLPSTAGGCALTGDAALDLASAVEWRVRPDADVNLARLSSLGGALMGKVTAATPQDGGMVLTMAFEDPERGSVTVVVTTTPGDQTVAARATLLSAEGTATTRDVPPAPARCVRR